MKKRLVVANPTPHPPSPAIFTAPVVFPESKGQPFNASMQSLIIDLHKHVQHLFATNALIGQPLPGEQEWAEHSDTLVRYVKASKLDLEKAQLMIEKTLNWRREIRPTEIKPEEIEVEAMDGKMYFSGFDRQGNPLLNIGPNQLSNDATRYTKFLIFWLENAHHMNRSNQQQQQQQQQMRHPHQKLTLLADLAKVSMFSVMSPTVYVKLLDIISSHYPETLHMLLIVNPSWYLHVLWKLVSPFVDPVTRAKVYFVDTLQKKQQQQQQQQGERPGDNEEMAGTGGWVNGLHEFIASDQLNSRLGGSHDFEYHHASYWSQLLTVLGK